MTGKIARLDARRRFEVLAGSLRRELYAYAFWLSRDPQLAEDVLQEALLRAWRGFDGLADEAKAKPWFATIVRREFLRTRERQREEAVDPGQLSELAADTADPLVEELREALFRLEDNYREPLVMQVVLGYSADEIAQALEMTPGAVLTRLHRAREKLKAMFVEGREDRHE